MNAGAGIATGDILLFLHADTRLSPNALTIVRNKLSSPSVESGIFSLQFDQSGFWPALYVLCSRVPWHHICFGDRGLFVKRTVFQAIEGYPDIPVFEDLHLVRRLHARGRFKYLRTPVTTAWRRFAHTGPIRQQLKNIRLWIHYMAGTPPNQMCHLYPSDSHDNHKP